MQEVQHVTFLHETQLYKVSIRLRCQIRILTSDTSILIHSNSAVSPSEVSFLKNNDSDQHQSALEVQESGTAKMPDSKSLLISTQGILSHNLVISAFKAVI
ncbi:UNVERIFIED_CONTAM: hypothetical protein K2H54_019252 [Gekko kuhli]